MITADIKSWQTKRQTVPNTCSSEVSLAKARTTHTHTCFQRKTEVNVGGLRRQGEYHQAGTEVSEILWTRVSHGSRKIPPYAVLHGRIDAVVKVVI